ncbi:membrane protein [Pontibacillus halophilus JSM 076056 = DSM 19796]|uniref:Membrane protein n=1 Tax=Pontibacillus halophilus JSM 076056 = DSM 19796 TaxID=1385510 RepID=A0A0A5GJI2_9BACI|nr:DUF1405 domain-containing protein [Pontibacillus halophilus]KGX92149.1 membrane protein [Pontibacillus halophilus JSM 076056 = DSM 19796]
MIQYILSQKPFILLLIIINLFGTLYGYWWYDFQLQQTPALYYIFVPDSPTASLFFTIALIFIWFNRNAPYVEALAIVTLFKYGVWAVVMNVLTLMEAGSLHPTGYMLILSHGAMALEGILYARFYKIKWRHLIFAGVWTLHNDVIDYVFEQMPIYGRLMDSMNEIGYFTFWLSILSLGIAYWFTIRRQSKTTYTY